VAAKQRMEAAELRIRIRSADLGRRVVAVARRDSAAARKPIVALAVSLDVTRPLQEAVAQL